MAVTGVSYQGVNLHSVIARDDETGYVPEIGSKITHVRASRGGTREKLTYRVSRVDQCVTTPDIDVHIAEMSFSVILERLADLP